jgi:hypothetical protein
MDWKKPDPPPSLDSDLAKRSQVFQAQPQLTFRLPDGPYEVTEEDGLVFVYAEARKAPVLIVPAPLASQFGIQLPSPPEPPKSGTRLK